MGKEILSRAEVWIGIHLDGLQVGRVVAATTLVGICRETDLVYGTVKERARIADPVWEKGFVEHRNDSTMTWLIKRVTVVKVKGRGRSKDNSKNLIPRGTSERNPR